MPANGRFPAPAPSAGVASHLRWNLRGGEVALKSFWLRSLEGRYNDMLCNNTERQHRLGLDSENVLRQ